MLGRRASRRPVHARAAVGRGRRSSRRRSWRSSTRRRSTCSTTDFPLRLTTGRRLESFNTGVQTGGFSSPLHVDGEALRVSPEDGARYGLVDGGRAVVSSRRGAIEAPVAFDRTLRPGPRVHEPALPRARRHERADDRRHRPALGNGGVQGDRDPGGSGWLTSSCSTRRRPSSERAAIDAVLGAPPDANGHRTARADRDEPPPPPPRPPRRAAPRRLGQRRRARLRVAPALGPAGGGVRRRDLLRAARARGAAGRRDARLHRSLVRAEGRDRRPRRAPEPVPRPLRARARDSTAPSPARQPFEEQLPAESPPLPQAGEPGAAAPAADRRRRRSRRRSTRYIAAGGFEALARARELGAERGDRRGDRLAPPRPRRRGVPDRRQVARRARPAGADALRRLQRRRVGAGDVQGPRADGE